MSTPVSSSLPHPLVRGLKYCGGAVVLTGAIAALKGGIAWGMSQYVYTLPWVGGWLQSLELVELSNLFVCALLGWGLGAMTGWMARPWGPWRRILVLALTLPIVFLSSYGVRYSLWLQSVAIASNLSPPETLAVTDLLLAETTGYGGLGGYFLYTTQVPIPPTELSALQNRGNDDQWFRSELTRYSGLEPGLFTLIFHLAGWGIRLFYAVLALLTAAIYFAKGSRWAKTRRPQPVPVP